MCDWVQVTRRKKRNWSLHDIHAPGWGRGVVKFFYQKISLGHQEKSHGEILLVHHVVFLVQIVAA